MLMSLLNYNINCYHEFITTLDQQPGYDILPRIQLGSGDAGSHRGPLPQGIISYVTDFLTESKN